MGVVDFFRGADKGLWVTGPRDGLPEGALRRARGLRRGRYWSLVSREGCTTLADLDAHTIASLLGIQLLGVGHGLYLGATALSGSWFDGNPLNVAVAPSSSGYPAHAFIASRARPRKVDEAGNVSYVGIEAPTGGFSIAKATVLTGSIDRCEALGAAYTGQFGSVLALDAVDFIEGANSFQITGAASTQRSGFQYSSAAAAFNFASFGGGVDSIDRDFVSFALKVNTASDIEKIYVLFWSSVPPLFTQQFSIALVPTTDPGTTFDSDAGTTTTGAKTDFEDVGGSVGQGYETYLPDETWVRVRIPKSNFSAARTNSADPEPTWETIYSWRMHFYYKTTQTSPIVHFDDLRIAGGTGLFGSYDLAVTFRNSLADTESNPFERVRIENVNLEALALTGLPISPDPQVNQRRIYCTLSGAADLFLGDEIPDNTSTSWTYATAEPGLTEAEANERVLDLAMPLRTDNAPPPDTVEGVIGPMQARMLWFHDTAVGAGGRVYYSPAGRYEGIEGWFDVSSDHDPVIAGALFQGRAFLFTGASVFSISILDAPVFQLEASPGTRWPRTVVSCPMGVFYQADDGIRVVRGAGSELAAPEALRELWLRGVEGYNGAFRGEVAVYREGEYLISDGTVTLALDTGRGTWRDLGRGYTALFWDELSGGLLGTRAGQVEEIEDATAVDDDGTEIGIEWDLGDLRVGLERPALVGRVWFDYAVTIPGGAVSLTPVLDGSDLDPLFCSLAESRGVVRVGVFRRVRTIGLRFSGSVRGRLEIARVRVEVMA